VQCAPALRDALAAAVRESGQRVVHLTSGAGHDAAIMASLTPAAMLFVRCAGGISHHPSESVDHADVAAAIAVVMRFLEAYPG
jgi:allantoate deiminase